MTIDTMIKRKGFTLVELGMVAGALASVVFAGTIVYFGGKALIKYGNEPSLQVERVNVLGDTRAEEFIELNGKKYFAEVDGIPVTEYIRKK